MRQVISFNNKNFPLFVPTPAEDPQFRFEANAASTVTFKQSNTSFSALQYKINGGSWNNFDLTTNVTNTVNLAQGDKMYVRGKRNQTGNGANFRATAGDISLKGDIRYLDDFETQLEATSMRFTFMFHSFFATGDAQSYITDVSGLKIPYTSYNGFAFSNLFDYCTRLTGAAPDLLASYIPGDYCCC